MTYRKNKKMFYTFFLSSSFAHQIAVIFQHSFGCHFFCLYHWNRTNSQLSINSRFEMEKRRQINECKNANANLSENYWRFFFCFAWYPSRFLIRCDKWQIVVKWKTLLSDRKYQKTCVGYHRHVFSSSSDCGWRTISIFSGGSD